MPTLEKISFTIAQTAEQEATKTVRIGYAYTLIRPADEGSDDHMTISVDILGHDPISHDNLATGVDAHHVECAPGSKQSRERNFIVAQSLLDEDFGTDEIKLRINAADSDGQVTSVMTPVIRGNF